MQRIKEAKFIISNSNPKDCPQLDKPEYAFIGRSNVGKSSLINMICNRKNLAKTSSTPGKTQLINHFLINDDWYLVDLPGYGYAKVSKKEQQKWGQMISGYLTKRENLVCVFVLIDVRLNPQQADLDFLEFAGKNEIPIAIIFTKSDKQSKNKSQKTISIFKKKMLQSWEEFPPYVLTSSTDKSGKEEILQLIDQLNEQYQQSQ